MTIARERPAGRSRADLRGAAGFLRGLGPFFARGRDEADPAEARRRRLELALSRRERSFAELLDRAVFDRPRSPYRRLLAWAGVERGALRARLAADGVEATLEALHDAGVRITLEEFKGRRPIVRPGLELQPLAADFDGPGASGFEAQTGGSGGAPRPLHIDLDLLVRECDHHGGFLDAFAGAAGERPVAIWHLAPPGAVGLKSALIHARLGRPAERWFAHNRPQDAATRHALFARAAFAGARLRGERLPRPEHVPPARAVRVAEWLADQRARGTPALLTTTASGGVRVCAAALEAGLDVSGSRLVMVGEPYTPAKAAVVARAGCVAASHYALTEAGLVGLACAAPRHLDEVHLAADKVAIVTRPRAGATAGGGEAIHLTSLETCSPKILINVETGDAALREERDCGCGALPAAYRARLRSIRSYEKLTSEGMHVLGDDVLALVEVALPSRFGGGPTDWQLAEEERDGRCSIAILARPELGPLDEREVVAEALSALARRGAGQRLMREVWADAGTLRLERAAPRVTAGGKIPALVSLPG